MKKYELCDTLNDELRNSYGTYPELLAKLLHYRGIGPGATNAFLSPDYEKHMHDPFLLKGMREGTERILRAFCGNEQIAVWSDYDADGIPGAVVLHDFFRQIGFLNFTTYIPHRHDEGFGLNKEGLDELARGGVKLIITIDCGIADAEEAAYAKELGLDVIITDHHESNGILPDASAIINPKQPGCSYPDKNLCGAAIAFKLVQAILKYPSLSTYYLLPATLHNGFEKWFLDMVGIATLSDMVPLVGENRVFAYYGLKVLRKSPRLGLRKLLSRLNLNQRYLTEDDVTFSITPRINAASRLGEPSDAFDLFTATVESEAERLAAHLDRVNDERKGMVASLVKQARRTIEERSPESRRPVLVIGNPSWRPSLLGPVATSLVEAHSRPVFLWGRGGRGLIKGSCRSDGSVNVISLMEATRDSFIEFGGHSKSGGFTVAAEKVHFLEQELALAYERVHEEKAEARIYVDQLISIDEVDESLFRLIEGVGPFGIGNPKPIFLLEKVSPTTVRKFGRDGAHLELAFENSRGGKVRAIGFFEARKGWSGKLTLGECVNLIASVEKSYFRGQPELRLRIVDII